MRGLPKGGRLLGEGTYPEPSPGRTSTLQKTCGAREAAVVRTRAQPHPTPCEAYRPGPLTVYQMQSSAGPRRGLWE